jgi:ABC-2 type transport system permease protein
MTLSPSTVWALITRDFLIARSYRIAVVLDVVLGALNLLVYFFISKTFGDPDPASLGSAPSYFAYAAVGVAMTTVINAATAVVSQRMRQEQLTGTLEATVSQPISPTSLAAGTSGLPFMAAIVRAAVFLSIAVLLFDLHLPNADWPGVAAVLVASGLALSSLGVGSAAMVMIIKRGDVVISLAVFALGLFSGALFPISVLPDWLQPIANVMPTRFCYDGLRSALFGGGGGWGTDVLVLCAYAVVLVPASLWAFAAALRWAKRTGSIAEY